MKRKEIAKHLDAIGTIVSNTHIATLDDCKELNGEIKDAAMKGLMVGIAMGASFISDEYKPHTPEIDALVAIGSVLEFLSGDADD